MRLFILFLASIFTVQIMAQKTVLLKKANGQQQAFYSNQPYLDAYTAASHGDTIYLPGGIFTATDIDKRIAIYGAGHYPDSTNATGKTIISNAFIITADADSLLLEGIEFNSQVTVNSGVNYLVCKRNLFYNGLNFAAAYCNNPHLEGNVFRSPLYLSGATNALVVNNIIEGTLNYAKNGDLIRNNIFIVAAYPIQSCAYANFENNIFKYNTDPNFLQNGGNSYNTFSNNVFTVSLNWWLNTNNNNYSNIDAATLLVNQSGSSFNYGHDYHLQSPGTLLGADGTQCGIYGGLFGYKEGGVPSNPHIRQKTVSGTTDGSGNLHVNITVAAQNN